MTLMPFISMGAYLIQLICPIVLALSVVYPLLRGWKQIHWAKSITKSWGVFFAGCMLKLLFANISSTIDFKSITPDSLECISSYLVFGIALGWFLPIVFHFIGVYSRSSWENHKSTALHS